MRLIDADFLMNTLRDNENEGLIVTFEDVEKLVNDMPTAKAVPESFIYQRLIHGSNDDRPALTTLLSEWDKVKDE